MNIFILLCVSSDLWVILQLLWKHLDSIKELLPLYLKIVMEQQNDLVTKISGIKIVKFAYL